MKKVGTLPWDQDHQNDNSFLNLSLVANQMITIQIKCH